MILQALFLHCDRMFVSLRALVLGRRQAQRLIRSVDDEEKQAKKDKKQKKKDKKDASENLGNLGDAHGNS